jgi:hypothetical protein
MHILLKQEIERRTMMNNNEMPELKAGMVLRLIDMKTLDNLGDHLFINKNWLIILGSDGFRRLDKSNKIVKIFDVGNYDGLPFSSINKHLNLIWSKKSEKETKIEEIENTIKDLEYKHAESISELKAKVKEMKEFGDE